MTHFRVLRGTTPSGPRVLELQIELRVRNPRFEPEVRAWVDVEPDGDLSDETELRLTRGDRLVWCGGFELPEVMPAYFLYRLGLKATAGAEWSLRVRDRTWGMDVLTDWDSLDGPKCWLVGSCWVVPAQSISSGRDAASPSSLGHSRSGAALDPSEPARAGAQVIMLAHHRRQR